MHTHTHAHARMRAHAHVHARARARALISGKKAERQTGTATKGEARIAQGAPEAPIPRTLNPVSSEKRAATQPEASTLACHMPNTLIHSILGLALKDLKL